MKKMVDVSIQPDEQIVLLADKIVYAQRKEWCDTGMRQLSMGLLKYRQFYSYDNHEKLPVIIWLCGGAFSEMKRNIWAPEMVYFAKHGYAVALVEYTVNQRMRFPEPIEDVKEAIRFLRANADTLNLNTEKIAIMGESAGGMLATMAAQTNGDPQYEKGGNLQFSSEVQAVVSFYGIDGEKKDLPKEDSDSNPDTHNTASASVFETMPNMMKMIKKGDPPTLVLFGTNDKLVPYQNGEAFHERMQQAGNVCDLILVRNAGHADQQFYQPVIMSKKSDLAGWFKKMHAAKAAS